MAVATAHRLSRDQVIWSFGPHLEPVLEVEPGETVTFETNDCFARFSIPKIEACPAPFGR